MVADQEELLDWVDESDNVIGTVRRSLANSDPRYIHREIAILIYDNQNRLLLQQRSKNKKVFPSLWIVSVAGHITAGSDPLETAHKELAEELGFDTKLNFIRKDLEKLPNETIFSYVYIGKVAPKTKIKIDPQETQQARFFTQDELNQLIKSSQRVEEGCLALFKEFWAGKLK